MKTQKHTVPIKTSINKTYEFISPNDESNKHFTIQKHTKITLMHTAHLVKGCIDRSIKTTHAKLLLSAIQKNKIKVYEEILPNLKEPL